MCVQLFPQPYFRLFVIGDVVVAGPVECPDRLSLLVDQGEPGTVWKIWAWFGTQPVGKRQWCSGNRPGVEGVLQRARVGHQRFGLQLAERFSRRDFKDPPRFVAAVEVGNTDET